MRSIDGRIRKIESPKESATFFDFEFWGESDAATYGLICLVQRSNPLNLFIVEMNSCELTASGKALDLGVVKDRASQETGVTDLVFPQIVRFNEKQLDVKSGFQNFLKVYEKPIPVYNSIFDGSEEAIQVDKISIEQFRKLGGKVHLLGNLTLQENSW